VAGVVTACRRSQPSGDRRCAGRLIPVSCGRGSQSEASGRSRRQVPTPPRCLARSRSKCGTSRSPQRRKALMSCISVWTAMHARSQLGQVPVVYSTGPRHVQRDVEGVVKSLPTRSTRAWTSPSAAGTPRSWPRGATANHGPGWCRACRWARWPMCRPERAESQPSSQSGRNEVCTRAWPRLEQVERGGRPGRPAGEQTAWSPRSSAAAPLGVQLIRAG